MLPAARIAAAIELLDTLFTQWNAGRRTPADAYLDQYFRARRFIGSKDRGAIAELVYWVLRHKASLEWWIGYSCHPGAGRDPGSVSEGKSHENPPGLSAPHGMGPGLRRDDCMGEARALVISALTFRSMDPHTQMNESVTTLFTGERYAPAPLTAEEKAYLKRIEGQPLFHPDMPASARDNYPAWLHAELEATFGNHVSAEMEALNAQAPVDLRANTLKISRDDLLAKLREEGIHAELAPLAPHGIRLAQRAPIFASPLFKAGYFEMQDAGSQLVAELAEAKPGMKVIDFCAGAGGKTLALAAQMKNKGRILAFDTSENRLTQMKPRLKRAGVDNVQLHVITSEHDAFLKRHKDSADIVLVDAPCSGSGTWRRNPDLKWRFTPTDLEELEGLQKKILLSASRLVKPGGKIIYATCSMLQRENESVAAHFLKSVSNFRVVSPAEIWDKTPAAESCKNATTLRLTPHQDGVDGFFAAIFQRLPEGA